jgi:alkanesulfonate monooxygenase SsuD/methylene tetrahydromethanopterin reductase-like flavin-dependent oxidoreductase (luciferase family)
MRVGATLPSMGHLSQPDNLMQAAKAAERLGYDTLWVADRLLYPVKPRTKYPVSPDGSLPDIYKRVLDPIEALTFVEIARQTTATSETSTRYSLLQFSLSGSTV